MNSLKLLNVGTKALLTNFDMLKSPYKLTFSITYWCNSRCKHCGIWMKRPKNEMTLEEIEKFAKKANYFSWFNITGGEPFLRPDIVDIARVFYKNAKNFYLFNVTTNSFNPKLIEERVREILELGIPRMVVTVSMDGDKETHEYVRGVPGGWEKVVETYKRLKELSKEHKNLKTYLGYTICPFNIGKFQRTFEAAKAAIPDLKPSDFHVNLFHFSGHYYSNQNITVSLDEYKEKVLSELEIVQKMRGNGFLDPIHFLDQQYVKYAKQFVQTNKTPLTCKAIQTSVFIDSWGNVFPCTIYEKNIGNLRDFDYDLMKIINTDKGQEIKQEVRELKCPNCWTPCEAYQMILANMASRRFFGNLVK